MESKSSKCFEEIIYYKFVDEELSLADRDKIREHLRTCEKCREFAAAIAEENGFIKELFGIETAVPDLTAVVMERLNNSRSRLRRWLPYAAVFALTAFLFIFLFTGRSGGPVAEETRVLVHSARVEGRTAQPHIFESKDPDVKYIWLEKL